MQDIPFKLEQLIFCWQDESPDNIYYLDTISGDVRLVHKELHDLSNLTDEIERDKDRFLYLPKTDGQKNKDDLRDFFETVTDQKVKSILDIAFESPHVLSAFKKILSSSDGEVERLDQFLKGRARLRVIQWLQANCINTDIFEEKPDFDPGEQD